MVAKAKAPVPTEAEIQKQILEYLKLRGIDAWRHNVGAFRTEAGGYVRAGQKGQSDIIGVLPGGRFLAVEVKRPGKKPTADQAAFLQRINESGGLAFWADNVGTVRLVLDRFV